MALTPLRRNTLLCLVALLLAALPGASSIATASGQFEVYCDGVGIFLSKIDGAPAPGKLVLFSYLNFPPGSMGGRYLGEGKWSDVFIYRDGCIPDGKCESIAHGKVWIDAWDMSETGGAPPKSISGKYEIDLNGKHLQGSFVAKEHFDKRGVRVCM
jgi:hypothetical protein